MSKRFEAEQLAQDRDAARQTANFTDAVARHLVNDLVDEGVITAVMGRRGCWPPLRRYRRRHDLDLATVYAALTYYHMSPDEMQTVEERRTELAAKADKQTTLTPPDKS